MSTSEAVAFEADEFLATVPAFALLDEGVRGLVAESFEPARVSVRRHDRRGG